MTNLKSKMRKVIATVAICLAASSAAMVAQTTDVYVGGAHNYRATIWKNGTPEYLTDGSTWAGVHSVVVENGDIYAVGIERNASGKDIAKVWKNGAELYVLTEETVNTTIRSVAVSNGDVYVVGYEYTPALTHKIWKNGVVVTGYSPGGTPISIFVEGNDIYVGGHTPEYEAVVWKNGNLLYTLSPGGEDYVALVFVENGDVYAAGEVWNGSNYVDLVWKNDEVLYTLETSFWLDFQSIYVSGGVVYLTAFGYSDDGNAGKFWINGVDTPIEEDAANIIYTSVFVSGGDVYVAGEDTKNKKALSWKNGEATTLSTNGWAHSVFVVDNSIYYTITASAGANGIITPSGEIEVAEGANKTFTFTANTNYEIDEVLIDGTNNPAAIAAGSYTFENVTENHTIHVTFKNIVGIVEMGRVPSLLRIYPNPTNGELRIESGKLKVNSIEIFDIVGRKQFSIFNFQLSTLNSINVSALPQGVYLLKLETEKGIIMRKFVKE